MRKCVIYICLLALTTAWTATAQPPVRDRRGPPLAEELDLSPEQRAEIRALQDAFREKMIEMRRGHRAALDAVQQLMRNESSTEPELVAAAERAGQLQTAIQVERIRHLFAMREVVGHEKALEAAERWRDREDRPYRGDGRDDWSGDRDRMGRPDRSGRPERMERMQRPERPSPRY